MHFQYFPSTIVLAAILGRAAAGDTMKRMNCWCMNDTQIGFFNLYQYYNSHLDKSFAIEEECVDFIEHEECWNIPNNRSIICQDYVNHNSVNDSTSMNSFCYQHRGHGFFTHGNEADIIWFNGHKRNVPNDKVTRNGSTCEVEIACGSVCNDRFRLPPMAPLEGPHGVRECRLQGWQDFWNLDICDGCGGFSDIPHKHLINDKGGPNWDNEGHYTSQGWYDTTGYSASWLLDPLPHFGPE